MKDEVAKNHDHIILFDGECNLCSWSVRFIFKNENKVRFYFSPLQSEVAYQLVKACDLSPTTETVIYLENGKCHTQSTAALKVARHLSGLWPLLYLFIIIPRPVRDIVYAFISKRRSRWFGRRKDACELPLPGMRERFLIPMNE